MKINSLKAMFAYILKLKFAPNLHLFLFNFEAWSRLYQLKKMLCEVDPHKEKKIIDVGGGTGALALKLSRKDFHIYDHNPKSIEIARTQFDNVTCGNGTKMNFSDNSFDYAISVHTLEHIPSNERYLFLAEMVRIARHGVFLVFPEGPYAEKICENYLEALRNRGKDENKWTLEHLEMGLPKKSEVVQILSNELKFKFFYKSIKNYKAENLYWSKYQVSNNFFLKNITTPFVSLYRYFMLYKTPSVEMVVIGKSKNQ